MMNNDYVAYKNSLRGDVDMATLYKDVPASPQPNFMYRNKGDLTFEDKSKAWGFGEGINSNGAAYSDLDNDGDLDILLVPWSKLWLMENCNNIINSPSAVISPLLLCS